MSSVMRAWWAMRSQKRRRHGGAPADLPPLPVVTLSNGGGFPNGGQYDIAFDITVDHKTWPVGSLEIWFTSSGSSGYSVLATITSDSGHYVHYSATSTAGSFSYKARYVSGDVVGAFSNELTVTITF
jgi:hypothetical protein